METDRTEQGDVQEKGTDCTQDKEITPPNTLPLDLLQVPKVIPKDVFYGKKDSWPEPKNLTDIELRCELETYTRHAHGKDALTPVQAALVGLFLNRHGLQITKPTDENVRCLMSEGADVSIWKRSASVSPECKQRNLHQCMKMRLQRD